MPVRDGTRLAVNIYRPTAATAARHPTIFAFTPYRARYFKDGKIEETFDQKIFGFRDLVQAGETVSVLVPYGPDWASYVATRISLNPAAVERAARAAVTRGSGQ